MDGSRFNHFAILIVVDGCRVRQNFSEDRWLKLAHMFSHQQILRTFVTDSNVFLATPRRCLAIRLARFAGLIGLTLFNTFTPSFSASSLTSLRTVCSTNSRTNFCALAPETPVVTSGKRGHNRVTPDFAVAPGTEGSNLA